MTPIERKVEPDEEFTLGVALSDDAMTQPVTDTVKVKITPFETPQPHPHKRGKNKKTKGNSDQLPNVGLPHYRLLTSDGRFDAGQDTKQWPEWMTDDDGGYVEDLGKGERIYNINIDNRWLQSYRRGQRGQILKDAISQKYILGMRIFLLGIERAINGLPADEDFDPDQFRRMAAKGASSTMLTLSDHLPKIITPVAEPE